MEYTRNVAYTPRIPYKIILAYKLNDANSSVNGSVGTQDTTVAQQTSMPTTIGIGSTSGGLSAQLCGRIKKIAYYQKRLSDSELQVLTNG